MSTPRTNAAIREVSDADGAPEVCKLCAELEEENTAMRTALEDIRTTAHCLAKAGPLSTPTLADAWRHFMELDAMAAAATPRRK